MPLYAPPTDGSGGHAITDEGGSALTARATLDFTGDGIRAFDDAGGSRTRVQVPGWARFHSGRWYRGAGQHTTDQFVSNGTIVYTPIWVREGQTFDGIGLEITTGGSAGALVRLGVYRDDGTAWPGALVVDAGTIDATTTGFKSITTGLGALASLAGDLYWTAAASQGAAATQPTARAISNGAHQWVGAGSPGSTAHSAYTATGVTGALAGTAAAPTGYVAAGAVAFLRAA